MKWPESQPFEDYTEKNDGPLSPVLGAKAARLRKVPGTWVRTVVATTFAVGSSLPVGFVHQSPSVLSALTPPLIASHHHTPLNSVYYLYYLVRRPRLILDFTLTLLFNHLVLTTYYSAVLPTSLFFWAVVLGSSILTLLLAEQMCVKREMSEGLVIATSNLDSGDVELGALRRD